MRLNDQRIVVLGGTSGIGLAVAQAAAASEIAAGYLYLMRQTFVTGQTLTIDGGGLLV